MALGCSSASLCRARLQHSPSTVLTWKTFIISGNINYITSKHIRLLEEDDAQFTLSGSSSCWGHPGNVGKVSSSLTDLQLTLDLPHKAQENPGLDNSTNILNPQSCSTGRAVFAVGCPAFKVLTDKRHLWNQN